MDPFISQYFFRGYHCDYIYVEGLHSCSSPSFSFMTVPFVTSFYETSFISRSIGMHAGTAV